MRAVGYFAEGARKNGSKRSIAEQNHAFIDFCTRLGYEVAATFLDTEEPKGLDAGFAQMLTFLRRADRGFTVVAVDSLGTLGPDLGQAALKLLEIEQTGCQVLIAHTGNEAFKELVETWADRGDGTPISEKVRSAMRRKAVKGEVLGRPPYGYRVGPRRRLELVPEEAVVVRYIFRLYLQEEMGIRKIAGQLNSEDVMTRRGGRWSMVTVRDILRNRAYLGHYSRFGTTVTGSHPALVSPEDFRKVQDRLQTRHGAIRTRTVVPFLLSGLVFCAKCQNKLIGVSRRQQWTTKAGETKTAAYRYYQCESRTNQNSCAYNTQRAAELEASVRASLKDDDRPVTRFRRAGNVDGYLVDLVGQVDRVEGRMKRNRRQVEELVADAAHGHITLERMKSLGGELAKEHQELEGELSSAKGRLEAQAGEAERAAHLEALRNRLLRDWEQFSFDDLQAALRDVIDRIEVDGEELRVFMRL
jgi:site-specific DNA recombinase